MRAVLLNHIAAILVFSGPLFYIGLLMAVDPAGIPTLAQWLLRVFRHFVHRLRGLSAELVEPEYPDLSRKAKRVVRITGVALLVFAIVV
jgi:hypothetical protein